MNDVTPSASLIPSATVVRQRLLMSGFCLLVQVAATDYGAKAHAGPAVFWLAFGSGLLWLVYRRSRIARGILVVGALFGAVIYALAAFEDADAAALALVYVGQAFPLLTRPVRQHVQTRSGLEAVRLP